MADCSTWNIKKRINGYDQNCNICKHTIALLEKLRSLCIQDSQRPWDKHDVGSVILSSAIWHLKKGERHPGLRKNQQLLLGDKMTKFDSYKGIKREWRNGKVFTGLVNIPNRNGWPYYEVRQQGQVIKSVAGLSRRTIQLAQEIVRQIGEVEKEK